MTVNQEAGLRKELGLWDLALAQVLCVVGSTWVASPPSSDERTSSSGSPRSPSSSCPWLP
jgi:hypothetical protein